MSGGHRARCEGVSDAGEDEVGFEELYAKAGENLEAVPRALLAAHPAVLSWLDRQPRPGGEAALVIGCGYGDDAEELCGCGFRVTAFDIAPTAIRRCRERFPGSEVEYRVADLFAVPAEWHPGFDLVVEIRTLGLAGRAWMSSSSSSSRSPPVGAVPSVSSISAR